VLAPNSPFKNIEGDLRQDGCDVLVYHGGAWILLARCVDEETAAGCDAVVYGARVICPRCGATAYLINADYGYGHGAEYKCYQHREFLDGYRFVSHSAEALAESDASRARSRANADVMRRKR
jgi:hypothetical protein